MKTSRIHAICLLTLVGCAPAINGVDMAAEVPEESVTPLEVTEDAEQPPAQITNQFGMTFRLVAIDTSRHDHSDSFPKQSYYLQETELTGEQNSAFRKAAFGDGTFESITWHYNGGFPSEWIEVFRYAQALSKFDTQYDYRLPTRSQWIFACKSGYEQRCDLEEPNAYGITGMLETKGDAEAIDGLFVRSGHEFGVLMGRWKNNWHEHDGKSKPDCPCEYWTLCNPTADDSLDEVIVGRFVLVPK